MLYVLFIEKFRILFFQTLNVFWWVHKNINFYSFISVSTCFFVKIKSFNEFRSYEYMSSVSSLFSDFSRFKTLLDMYLNTIDTQNNTLIIRPVSLEELNTCLKRLIKTSRYLKCIDITHLKITFCMLMSILKNCFNIKNIITRNVDTADVQVVFFDDLIHIATELFRVLESKYQLSKTH